MLIRRSRSKKKPLALVDSRKPFHNLLHLTTDEKTDRKLTDEKTDKKLFYSSNRKNKFPISSMPNIAEWKRRQRPLSQWVGTFTDLNSISK